MESDILGTAVSPSIRVTRAKVTIRSSCLLLIAMMLLSGCWSGDQDRDQRIR